MKTQILASILHRLTINFFTLDNTLNDFWNFNQDFPVHILSTKCSEYFSEIQRNNQ